MIVKFRLLDVGYNNFKFTSVDQSIWETMKQNTTLECLLLNGISFNDVQVFSRLILNLPHNLLYLNLQNCDLFAEHMYKLSESLHNNKSVQLLDLSENAFNAEAAQHITLLLQQNNILLTLNLKRNRLWDQGGRVIAKALEYSQIAELDLSQNALRASTVVIAESCSKASKLNLKYINLDFNQVTTAQFNAIKKLSFLNTSPALQLCLNNYC